MPQLKSPILDELGKIMTDVAGLAQGAGDEAKLLARGQMEKLLSDMDLVTREEFDAVKAMAQKARLENEELKARLAALEKRLK